MRKRAVFAKRLTELRTEKGISRAQPADLIDSGASIVCCWDTDRSEATAPYLVKLADFFGVSVDHLSGRPDI